MGYTKGGWRVHPTNKTDVYALNNGSHFIAECGNAHLPNGEDIANAHLIAAAPDLYEALKETVKEVDIHTTKYDYGMKILAERARKAILKVETKNATIK